MKKPEKIFFTAIVDGFFPLLFFGAAFLLWFYLSRDEHIVPYIVFPALAAGLLVAGLLFRKLYTRIYSLPLWILTGLYLFYSIIIYGTFMGFPVFNAGLGIVAGYYLGRRLALAGANARQTTSLLNKLAAFTAAVMFFLCLSTGILAVREKTLGAEIQHIFRLNFDVTRGMILTFAIVGGLVLLIGQYYVTRLVFAKTFAHGSG